MTTVAELRRMADVQEHFEKGGKVEAKWRHPNECQERDWVACPTSVWNWEYVEYRIAPEPRKPRECWRWEYEHGVLGVHVYSYEKDCHGYGEHGRPVRFIEDIE